MCVAEGAACLVRTLARQDAVLARSCASVILTASVVQQGSFASFGKFCFTLAGVPQWGIQCCATVVPQCLND